ncbi:MAG: GNAT family N-acetyltransferase [Clostridia bacterium]|nr:GNAT family N-acetyltransferase [Clostridia bacterium]
MQVSHPVGMFNHLPPEDVFLATDEMGNDMGMGYMVYQYQPHLYPDCPINLYFSLDCQPAARYMLFGALVARARQLRDCDPTVRARVYTNIAPQDLRMKDFYEHSGFDCSESEEVLQLPVPIGDGRIPMSCAVAPTAVNTPEEQAALLYRLQQNDITYIDQAYLNQLQRMPHFMVLGLYRNTELVGEVIMAGEGDHCELAAIYITPPCRRQGMGRALLHRCMAIMAAEGVSYVTARIMSRSQPQKRLMNAFNAQVLGQTMIYPGLFL